MRCVESVPFVVTLARFRADACAPRVRGPMGFFLRRTVQWTGWSFERHMIASRMHCQFFSLLQPHDVVPTILFSFQTRLPSTWRTVQIRPLHHVLCRRSGCSSPLLLFASIRISRPCSGTRHVRVGRLVLPKLGSSPHVRRDVSRSTCSFPIQIPQQSLADLLSSSDRRFHAFCDAFVALDALPRRPCASHVAQQHVEASLSFVSLRFGWAPGTDRRGFQSTFRFERKENRTSVRDKRGILPLRTWGQEPPREVLQGRRSWRWRPSWEVDQPLVGRMHPGADALVSTVKTCTIGDGTQGGKNWRPFQTRQSGRNGGEAKTGVEKIVGAFPTSFAKVLFMRQKNDRERCGMWPRTEGQSYLSKRGRK